MWRGKRRLAVQQLEQHAAEGPEVDGLAVAPLEDHLRCHVGGRAAEGEGAEADSLREAEVCELSVAAVVK